MLSKDAEAGGKYLFCWFSVFLVAGGKCSFFIRDRWPHRAQGAGGKFFCFVFFPCVDTTRVHHALTWRREEEEEEKEEEEEGKEEEEE